MSKATKQSEWRSFHPPIQALLWGRVKGWGKCCPTPRQCHCEEQRDAAIHRVSKNAFGECGSVTGSQWIATGFALAMTGSVTLWLQAMASATRIPFFSISVSLFTPEPQKNATAPLDLLVYLVHIHIYILFVATTKIRKKELNQNDNETTNRGIKSQEKGEENQVEEE